MQFMFSRKSGIVLAALLGVQLILPASGWALTGRDVALKADQVDTSRTSDMSMAMIIKRGDQQLVRFMAMKKRSSPILKSSTSAFSNRGTSGIRPISRGVTGISTKTMTCGSTCPPSRWSAASAEAAKRAPSCAATTPMRTFHGGKSTRTPIPCCPTKPSPAWTATCWRRKLSSQKRRTIPNGLSGSERYLAAREIDFYDQGGNRCKELVFGGYKEIQGIWTATRQRMRTVGSDSETIMEIREVAYNTPIAEDIFLPQDLKR